MDYIIYSAGLVYLLNAVYYFIGIFRLKRSSFQENGMDSSFPFVSVIIPARNEENNLPDTLNALENQSYPTDKWELVLIDDGSTDNTLKIAEEAASRNSNFHVLSKANVHGQNGHKKHAVQIGVKEAKGEIIVTTDADCIMSESWLINMIKEFDEATGMVVGIPVYQFKNNLLESYQALDYASLSLIAAALVENKTPIMCSAANMSYRKQTFEDVKGYESIEHFISGDDDLLLQKIVLNKKWKIKATINPETFTYTKPVDSWGKLINQRSRWGSKGAYYPLKWVRFYLTVIFLMQFVFAFGWLFGGKYQMLHIWSIKFFIDLVMTILIANVLSNSRLFISFPLLYISQPYMIFIAAIKGFFGKFSWK